MVKYNLDEILSVSNSNKKKKKYDLDDIINMSKQGTATEQTTSMVQNSSKANNTEVSKSNNSINKDEAIKNINNNKQLSPEMKKTLIQSLNNEQTNSITENKITELNQRSSGLKNAGELMKTPVSDIIGDNELYDIKYLEKELGTSKGFFEASEAFKDGYQFGDVSKTVASTVGDAGLHVVKGIGNLGEGIGDLITYGIAQGYDLVGNEEKAKQLRDNAKESVMDALFNPAFKAVNKNSVLGNKSDELAEGLGYVAGMTAVSVVSGGAGAKLGLSSEVAATIGSTATTFSSSMGNGMSEAYQNGATDEEAFWYGVISGSAEAGSELMFGGLGKASGAIGLSKGIGAIDDKIANTLTKDIKNKMVKTLIQSGIKASAEGAEEVVSGLISAVGKKATYMSEEDLQKIIKDENLAEQFWMGTLTSAIAQGPSTIKSVKNGTDFITGYTENEQKVYDTLTENKANEEITKKTVDNMINEQKETLEKAYGRELTADELTEIENAVNAVKESGKLNIENTKLSKKERGAIEENIKEDLENGNLKLETLKEILGEDANIDNDGFLQRSVYENEQKYSNYKAEFTGNEKVDKLLQSAVDSGVNNTSKTRKMVDVISKLVENTDRQYRFVNQEQLKEMGYNENANGLTDKSTGEILLSVNSNKQIEAVVGHETTHLFDSKVNGEYTQEYKDLQKSVTEFLKSNGTYETKVKEIMDTYTKAGITLTQEQLMEEVTADTIGDNLFGENAKAFINQLTTNRNVFQKIYDYIKKAVMNLKGYKTEEAKRLQNLKDSFDKVYKTLNNNGTDTDIKYSIGGEKAIENIKNTEFYKQAKDNLDLAKEMKSKGKSNLELVKDTGWYQDQAGDWKFEFSDKNMELKKTNFSINKEYDLSEVLEHDMLFYFYPELANTKVIFENKDGSAFSKKGNIISISSSLINDRTELKAALIHEIQHNIQNYENYAHGASVKGGVMRYLNTLGEIEATDTEQRYLNNINKKANTILPETAKNNPTHQNIKDGNVLAKIANGVYNYLHGGNKNVFKNKKNMEQNSSKNRTLVDERGRIEYSLTEGEIDQYWKKQTIDNDVGNISNTENSEQGSFNLPKNTEKNTIENEVGNTTTVQENNTDKYKRYKQNILKARAEEINNLIKSKNDTIREIEHEITEKEKLLNSKKDKTTKVANELKMQIEGLKQRKTRIENEYNSRIDRKNDKVTKDRIDIETKKQLKLTREDVKKKLLQEMGITEKDIAVGEDIKAVNFQITDPVRANEKVFGKDIGTKINNATINKTKHNTAEKIRWQNKEREDIKDLGIKARSKESAAVQKYGEKQYIDEYGEKHSYGDFELANEFSDVKLQERIKHAANVIRNKYDTFLEQVNNVLTGLGYNPIPKREDYMRHFQELTDKFSQTGIPLNLNDMNADVLPTDINGLTAFNKPGKNWFASALQRTGEKTVYDAVTGIDGYIEAVGNLIYHTGDIQNYRTLSSMIRETYGQEHGLDNIENMTEEEATQRIKDVQNNKLSRYVAWLDEQANSLAGKKGFIDRGFESALGRRIYNVLNTAKKQVGSNMTGFNVRSALTNFISTTIAASKTKKLALAKGTVSTIRNMFHNDGFIDKSDFLTSRFGSEQLSTKLWQKVANAGQILMSGSDYFTSNLIARSKYYEGLQKGMTEQEALNYSNDFSARVMGDRSQGATAEIFNSKTLGLLTQFQLETNNQWQFMVHDTKMDYQQNAKENNGMKAGATALFQMGQLAAYSYFFNELFEKVTGSRAAFDPIEIIKTLFGLDDDDKEKDFDERMSEAGALLVDNIPFANLFTGGGRIPVSEAFTGVSTLIKKQTGGTDEYGNKITWEDVKNDTLSTLPYWVLPTGYSQIKKTVNGLNLYSKENPTPGSYTDSGNLRYTVDEDVGSKVQAALFGAYANPYAQDYVDSGYKTISKKNIDEMVGLDMNSSEYREFRKGLSAAGTKTEDKLNYIDASDLTTEQKNLVANNLNSNSKKSIDMEDYGDYNSYEEYKYARDYPEKYNVIKQIDTYDNYNTYKQAISDIKEQYSTENGYDSDYRKQSIRNYIESLDLDPIQKLMLEKMAGGYSIKQYKSSVQEYLDSTDLTQEEKYYIWEELFN